jgi:hypothetical protein
MRPVSKATLRRAIEELAGFSWEDADLEELVSPKFGVITGFQDLVNELDELRQIDLGTIAPAGVVRRPKDGT